MPAQKYLTIQQAATYLKVSSKTLRRWEESGKINAQRTEGGHRRYLLADLISFKRSHHKQATIQAPSFTPVQAFPKHVPPAPKPFQAYPEQSFSAPLPQRKETQKAPNAEYQPRIFRPLHLKQERIARSVKFTVVFTIVSLLILNSGIIDRSKESLPLFRTSLGTENVNFAYKTSQVLATRDSLLSTQFNVNIESNFTNDVNIEGTLNLIGNELVSSEDLLIQPLGGGVSIGDGLAANIDLEDGDLFVSGDSEFNGNLFAVNNTLSGSLSVALDATIDGDAQAASFTLGTDTVTDFTGTGISIVDGALTATVSPLGDSIDTSEIADGTITEVDLNASNSPTNGYVLTYNSSTSAFTWTDVAGSVVNAWSDSGTLVALTTTTDNVNIGGSTDLAKLAVDGDTDEIQLLVQANATQTSLLAVFEQSDGTNVVTIDNSGNLTLATGADLTIGAIGLNDFAAGASGAGLIGVDNTSISQTLATDLQTVLEDISSAVGSGSSKWTVNTTPTPDVIYPTNSSSTAGFDVAFGGTSSTAPFFFDVSTGSFSAGVDESLNGSLTLYSSGVGVTDPILTADASGNVNLTVGANGLLNVLAGNLKIGNGTPTQSLNGEDAYVEGSFELDGILYAGSGNEALTLATGKLDADALTLATGTTFAASATNSSVSGLEVISDGLSLIRGCTAGQVLKWDTDLDDGGAGTSGGWYCADDTGGLSSAVVSVKEEGGSEVDGTVLSFNAYDFLVNEDPADEIDVSIDYVNFGSHTSPFNIGDSLAGGSAGAARTIDIGGVDTDLTNTINIATNSTSADTLSIGNSNASTTVAITGGNDWSVSTAGAFVGSSFSDGTASLSAGTLDLGTTTIDDGDFNGAWTFDSNLTFDEATNDLVLAVADQTNGAFTLTIPSLTANADLCLSTGNCAGAGGGVTESGTQADTQIAYFTGDGVLSSSANFSFDLDADTENLLSLASTGLTTGNAFDLTATYIPTAGGTQSAIDINLTNNASSSANTLRGLDIGFTDAGTLTNTIYGAYIDVTTANANDTTYAASFLGGNVGIGDSSPAALFTVGSGDPFQVDNLGAVTALTYNALTLTEGASQFSIAGGTGSSRTLTVNGDATLSGTNTGDQNLFSSIVVPTQTTITPSSTTTALNVAAGTGVTLATDNSTKTLTISATGTGGDVVGPASATDNAIARFNLTTGKLIQDSTVTISDLGDITLTKEDPSLIFNAGAASDTKFWAGVVDDNGNDDDDLFQIGDGATPGTNPFLTILTDGKVGVGTAGPDAALDILTTSDEKLRLTETDGSAFTSFSVSDTGDLTINSSGGDVNITDRIGGVLGFTQTQGAFSVDLTTGQKATFGNNLANTDSIAIEPQNLTATNAFTGTITSEDLTDDRTYTLPDGSGTFALLDVTQIFTGENTFQGNLNFGDAAADTITVTGSFDSSLNFLDAATGTAYAITGSDASTNGNAGGALSVIAGSGLTTGAGGNLVLASGDSPSGTDGYLSFLTGGASGTERFRIQADGTFLFEKGSNDLTLSVTAPSGASRIATIPALSADDTFVFTTLQQSLSNKTLVSPTLSGNTTVDLATNDLTLAFADQTSGAYTLTFPVITDNRTVCTTEGNCFGSGGGGVSYTSQTTNALTKFSSTAGEITSSNLLDDGTNLYTTKTITNSGTMFDFNLTLGADADADIVSALNIDVTSANTGDADELYGININNLASVDATVIESAIRIGEDWQNIFEIEGSTDDANDLYIIAEDPTADRTYTIPYEGSDAEFCLSTGNCAGVGGTGDVVGPASSTDHAIARFDLTTGKLIQNSSVTIDDSGNLSTGGTLTAATTGSLNGLNVNSGALGAVTGFTQTSGVFSSTLSTTNSATFSSSTANTDTIAIKPQTTSAAASFTGTLTSLDLTGSDKTWSLPNTTGTIALTSDIPTSDNYQNWVLQADAGSNQNVTTGYIVDFSGSNGITTTAGANSLAIAGVDATTSTKGVASFNDSYFTVTSGDVTIDDIYLRNNGDEGTGAYTFSLVNGAGASANSVTLSGTLGAFDNSDTFRGLYLNYANANHTGSTNAFYGIDIAGITADAEATENALNIGAGWDNGIYSGSNITLAANTLLDLSAIDPESTSSYGLKLPTGTSLSSTGPGGSAEGYLAYESDTNLVKVWDGSAWASISGASTTLQQAYTSGNTIDITSGEGALDIDAQTANVDFEVGEGTDTGDFRIWDGATNWLLVDEGADTIQLGAAAGNGLILGDAATGDNSAEVSIFSSDWEISSAGAITGATYEGLTITTSTGTLDIANGKTLNIDNSLTFAGVDSDTWTFPAATGASGTVVGRDEQQTLTNKTLTSPRIGTAILDTNGNELINLTATGSAVNELTLANAAALGNPTWTATGASTDIGISNILKADGTFGLSSTTANSDTISIKPQTTSAASFTGTLTSLDLTGSNKTWSLPNETGTICTTGSVCTGYQAAGTYDNYVSWSVADDDTDTYAIVASNILRFTSSDGNVLTNLTNGDDGDENLDFTVNLLGDLVAGAGLTGGADNILVGADVDRTVTVGDGVGITVNADDIAFNATELDDIIWSDNANASNTWTFDVSGTDPQLIFGNNTITVGAGTLATDESTFNLINTTATTLNLGGAATTFNIGPTGSGAGNILLAGGSGDTGCTLDQSNGNLNCSGTITGSNGALASTLQNAYDNDANGSDSLITLSGDDDSLIFRNPTASAGTDSAFVLQLDNIDTGVTTADFKNLYVTNAGTFDTTAGNLATYGGYYLNSATESAGGNALNNYGIYTQASGGDYNNAINAYALNTSSSARTLLGVYASAYDLGTASSGTATVKGLYADSVAGVNSTGSNITGYGVHINAQFGGGAGTITGYGLYINANAGPADSYHSIYSAGGQSYHAGNFGIGDSSPAAALSVGNGDLFQVSSTGDVSFVGTGDLITKASSGDADDLDISVTGATNSSLILSSAGTGADALSLNTSAGGIDINSAGNVTVDTTDGSITLTAGGASNGDITLAATDDISINGTAGSALNIGTSNVTQTINIGLATNIDLALTDPNWSITGAGAGTLASLLVDSTTLDANSLSSSGALGLNSTGANLSLTTTTSGDISLDPAGGGDITLVTANASGSYLNISGLTSGSGNALCVDGSNNVVTCTVGSGGVSGSGTEDFLPRWDSSGSNLVDSALSDNDTTLSIAASRNLSVLNVNAAAGSSNAATLSGTLGAFDNSDTFRGLYLNYTNADHAGTSNAFYGIDIAAITGDAQATENAINIGSGWDSNLFFNDTTTSIGIADTGVFTLEDAAGNDLLTLTDNSNAGDLSITGDLVVSGGNITGPSGAALVVAGDASQALTLTGNAASVWSTTAGNLSVLANSDTANLLLGGGDTLPSQVADGNDVDIRAEDDIILNASGDIRLYDGGAALNCSGSANGGVLTTDANGVITCGDDDTGASSVTLQTAYNNDTDTGNTTIAFTAADDSIVFSNPDATGTDSAFIFQLDNLDTTADGITDYLLLNTASTDTTADAIDVSDAGFFNAINVGANNIAGTTAVINFDNFDVASTGNITVAAGVGLDTNGAGELQLGYTTATTVSVGTTAATTLNLGAGGALTRAFNIGTGTGADTINIGTGGSTADDINIGGLATSTIGLLGVTSVGDGGATNYAQFNATGDLTFVGTADTIVGPATFNLLNSASTQINFGGAATTFNIGPTGSGAGNIVFAGGSGDTGCTLDQSNGNLVCSGNITGAATGTVGYWTRTGTTLTTATGADNVTVDGTLDANGVFTIGDGGDTGAISSTTLDIDATGALQINSSGGAISIGNDAVAQAINIGTGSAARTITVGNNTGASALAFTSGTGAQTFTSSAATTGAFAFVGDSISSGTGFDLSFDALAGGKGINLTSTSTAVTTGNLFSSSLSGASAFSGNLNLFEFSGAATATGDLVRINLGASSNIGNLLNITDNGTTLFSVSESQITSALPHQFTSAGDVSFAYDIIMANQTASNISSLGPITLEAGESFESNDLTLKTYNAGDLVADIGGNLVVSSADPAIVFDTLTATDTDFWMAVIEDAGGDDDDLFQIGDGTTIGTNPFLTVNTSGGVGIADVSPSGTWLDIGANTTAIASLRLNASSAVNVSSPAIGDLWFNGTNLNFRKDGSTTVDLLAAGTTPTLQQAYEAGETIDVDSTNGALTIAGVSANIDFEIGSGTDTGDFRIWDGTNNWLLVDEDASTVNLGNANGATALNLTSGTGAQTFTSSASTTGSFAFVADSITSGTGFDLSFDGLAAGKGINLTSTSTAVTTGSLFSSSLSGASAFSGNLNLIEYTGAATATGDLLRINIGASSNVGNLFNITDNGSSLFAVNETQITSALPHQFTAAGDVTMAYDLVFTNQTASVVKSYGPLTIESGESFENQNLTLKTYGTGKIIADGGFSLGAQETLEDSTTPSVGGASHFVAANSTNRLVTTFDDGTAGQIIVIESSDTDLDFDCAGSEATINCGNVDLAAAAGDIFVWIYDGTVWNLINFMESNSDQTGSDLAEWFPANGEIAAGEVVSIDGSDPIKVQRALESDGQRVIGIVSTDPGLILGQAEEGIPYAQVALAGRVPVKVDPTSAAIANGDLVGAAATAGMAKKVDGGWVIGRALEAWTPGSGQETVTVFVNPIYVNQTQFAQTNYDQQILDLQSSLSLIQSQLDLGEETSSSGVFTDLTVNQLTVLEDAVLSDTVINGKLNIGTIQIDNANNSIDAIGALKIQPLALGNIEFMGGLISFDTNGNIVAQTVTAEKYKVAGASAGTGILLSGTTEVEIESDLVNASSLILVTPKAALAYPMAVTAKEEGVGFTVSVQFPENYDVEFDWFIVDKN